MIKLKNLINEDAKDYFKGGKIKKMDLDKGEYWGVGKTKLSDRDKEKARKLGLVWKGKGYGKDGQDGITHKNVDGKLVKVDKGGDSDKKSDKPEPKKLSGKDFDRDLPSDGPNPTSKDSPLVKKDEPKKQYGNTTNQPTDEDSVRAAQDVLDQIKNIEFDDSFEDGPEDYETVLDALGSITNTELENWEELENKIKAFESDQDADSGQLLKMTLQSVVDKKDVYSNQYLGAGDDNIPKDDPYTDDEIEAVVDKDVDEIKAMLYGKNPLAKYMSYRDDKRIQQHLDALKDVGQMSPYEEDFHKDELYSVMRDAQQNMQMGKVKQGERFSGNRTNLPKSKVGTKVEDGKIKSSGPQQFADDIKNIKGEYDLGDVTIKDGKMFDADGEEMDSDDIEDFYYQDAFDEEGNNVGIDIKNENYNPSDKYLTESVDLLKREFGAPLPTLQSVMEKHQKNIKEGPDDVKVTKKQLQMLIKQEGDFRKRMLNIEQGFLRDPRPENKKLAKEIKKSYKDNVTKFMREVVGMLKRMK